MPLLHVVLHQPDIPQNTGNIGRTCVAVGAKLWLIRPLGFQLDERHLARAGMDYWDQLDWEAVDSWAEFRAKLAGSRQWAVDGAGKVDSGQWTVDSQSGNPHSHDPTDASLSSLSTAHCPPSTASSLSTVHRPLSTPTIWCVENPAAKLLWDATFSPGDVLLFGSETRGLPKSLLDEFRATTVQLPMRPAVRSLNLASTVNTAVYEAVRQFGGIS